LTATRNCSQSLFVADVYYFGFEQFKRTDVAILNQFTQDQPIPVEIRSEDVKPPVAVVVDESMFD